MLTFLRMLAVSSLILAAAPAVAQVPFGEASAVKEGLEIGTSTSEIAITSDFRGADLTVFGALTNADELFLAIGQYDVIVTLEGPRDYATVRRKERVLGIWMNTDSMTFEQVPESYSLASTREIDAIDEAPSLNSIGVGINHLALTPTGYLGNAVNLSEFREAYRRLKLSSGLYQRDTSGVRFVSSSLFRASLRLPANIPDGVHTVRAYLFKGGELIFDRELPLRVVKTGIEQAITDAARNRPIAYGFLCVLIAVITGWGASLVFRKD
ncbi:putative transmembrane protein precursor [Pseudorhizobium banfieldiae]|uniref:Putative transmembrane protein n=1 Tax=Pseudorhizobium banfieldiae TaxID=1125847 RepID=L0NAR2_9HYPH|nr:TIGR02186 family protein [Pseudorhizobium banfieldiae]CAD6597897.1 TIGR02186 family protein [arsenite-oxidising bacterium NT-25]CAD6603700.1 TIGR02186 family protein [Rhizobium sp. TCK]CCF17841.1 putative transmembrane protein precursor [Pseudorhizobium banfieldiae]